MSTLPVYMFANRLWRAARLDAALYEEVERDKRTLAQAFAIVLLSSIAAGVGALLPVFGWEAFFWGIASAVISWFLWAWVTFLVGVKILPESQTSSDMGELLRAIGFASAPGMLRVLGVIEPLREPIFLVASIWMLVTIVVAVRQALDYSSTGRAILVCLIGWFVQMGLLLLLSAWNSGNLRLF